MLQEDLAEEVKAKEKLQARLTLLRVSFCLWCTFCSGL